MTDRIVDGKSFMERFLTYKWNHRKTYRIIIKDESRNYIEFLFQPVRNKRPETENDQT